MMRAFRALRGVYGSVVEVINKSLARINITSAPWFERFSMVYAGIVTAVETVEQPGAALRDAVGSLREVVGGFFGSLKAKVGDVAGLIKQQLQELGNPARLMQRLADRAVEMALNFIVTHPPSALVKVAFKAIETGAKTSIVDLVRQHIPFADTLIQRIADSEAVKTLLQPLAGPVATVSSATERVAGAAGGLIGDVESRVGGLMSDGAQLVRQLSGIEIDNPAARSGDEPQAAPARRAPAADNAALTGAGVLGVVTHGLHTRLLAIGTRNLMQRGRQLGKATLQQGLSAGKALAGKIKGLLIGEVVDFEARGERHELWVEDRGAEVEIMVASSPAKLAERIAKFEAALAGVSDPVRKRTIQDQINGLKLLSSATKGRGKNAEALKEQKQKLVDAIRRLLKHPELSLDEAETTFSDLGRELRTRRKDIDMHIAEETRRRAPQQYRDFVYNIRDLAAAAAVKDDQFMRYWRAAQRTDNWANAGTRFHKLAQDIGQAQFEKPGGWPFAGAAPFFELQVSGGKSRFDVLIVQFEPTFMLYEFDYKTGSRSAAASVDEMEQHFRHVRKDMRFLMEEELMQESVSWREAVERELRKAAAPPPTPAPATRRRGRR
jgi:polyhydroxyalkanoate synthesis regulator phasin